MERIEKCGPHIALRLSTSFAVVVSPITRFTTHPISGTAILDDAIVRDAVLGDVILDDAISCIVIFR